MRNRIINLILVGIILNIFVIGLAQASSAAIAGAAGAAASANNANNFNHGSSVAKGAVDFSIEHKCKITAYNRYSINEFWCRDNDNLSNITSCYLKTNGDGQLVEQRCNSVRAGGDIDSITFIVATVNIILVVVIVWVANKIKKGKIKEDNINNMKGGKRYGKDNKGWFGKR